MEFDASEPLDAGLRGVVRTSRSNCGRAKPAFETSKTPSDPIASTVIFTTYGHLIVGLSYTENLSRRVNGKSLFFRTRHCCRVVYGKHLISV